MQSAVLSFPQPEETIPTIFEEMKSIRLTARMEIEHPRLKREPIMGTCCVVTTACVKTMPGAKCIFNDCADSKGYENCMACQHWSNPADPCHLEKVSRNYCPAILRHRDSSI
jgi:hypothetical protein